MIVLFYDQETGKKIGNSKIKGLKDLPPVGMQIQVFKFDSDVKWEPGIERRLPRLNKITYEVVNIARAPSSDLQKIYVPVMCKKVEQEPEDFVNSAFRKVLLDYYD